MGTIHRPTKAQYRRARREAARAAAVQTKRRTRMIRVGLWSAAGVAAIALVAVAVLVLDRPPSTQATGSAPSATPQALPSTPVSVAPPTTSGTSGRTTAPPWGAPTDTAAAVAAAGLTMLGEEGTALHFHTHLDVIVDGAPVPVPADIGVDDARHRISPLHSHDATGVIHVESPTKSATFSLGQFFTQWQVSISADHIGGLAVDATHHLLVYVNGTLRPGDPAGIILAAHDEIAIVYGADAQPDVPRSYRWTNGL